MAPQEKRGVTYLWHRWKKTVVTVVKHTGK